MLKALKHGKEVPTAGIEAVKRYELPLPVITEFEIKTESDKAIFNTVCWGLHDAHIEKVETVDNDMIIKFDTTWEKHVTVSFHNVYAATGLENVACILDSSFKIERDRIEWEVTSGYDLSWDGLAEGSVSVTAKSVSWQLTID